MEQFETGISYGTPCFW